MGNSDKRVLLGGRLGDSHATSTQDETSTLGPEVRISQLQTITEMLKTNSACRKKLCRGHGGERMCVSQNVWMYVLSAAIGGIISFLLLKFWNLPQNEATRNLKIPVEHDERWG